jgi:hypothetical protein
MDTRNPSNVQSNLLRSSPSPLHASCKISFTTRHGLVSVMRSSWPLWK